MKLFLLTLIIPLFSFANDGIIDRFDYDRDNDGINNRFDNDHDNVIW